MKKWSLALALVGAAVLVLAPLLSTPAARAEGTSESRAGAPGHWDLRYRLGVGTRFRISQTTLGAGDGVRELGPGTLVVRLLDSGGRPGPGRAELRELAITTRFSVGVGMLGLRADVETRARSWHDGKAPFAVGHFDGKRVRWSGPAQRYTARGTAECAGLLCGRFGAPPAGPSPVGTPPHAVNYADFVFTPEQRTLTSDYVKVSESASPRQLTELRLAGTLERRTRVD